MKSWGHHNQAVSQPLEAFKPLQIRKSHFWTHQTHGVPVGSKKSSTKKTYRTPVGICKIVPLGMGTNRYIVLDRTMMEAPTFCDGDILGRIIFSLKHQRKIRGWRISKFKFWVEGSPGIKKTFAISHPSQRKGNWVVPSEFVHDCCSCCWFHFRPFGPSQMSTSTSGPTNNNWIYQQPGKLRTLSSTSRNFREAWCVDHYVI